MEINEKNLFTEEEIVLVMKLLETIVNKQHTFMEMKLKIFKEHIKNQPVYQLLGKKIPDIDKRVNEFLESKKSEVEKEVSETVDVAVSILKKLPNYSMR